MFRHRIAAFKPPVIPAAEPVTPEQAVYLKQYY